MHRTRPAFTLVEILTTVVIIAVLSTMGAAKYTQFTREARRISCVSNQSSIAKAMGVWEAKNTSMGEPKTGSWDLLFNTRGQIDRCDDQFPRMPAQLADDTLTVAAPGREVILRYVKDVSLFCCPERINEAGGIAVLQESPEGSYTFRIDSMPVAAFNGAKRGVWCVRFAGTNKGPDGTDETRHRP